MYPKNKIFTTDYMTSIISSAHYFLISRPFLCCEEMADISFMEALYPVLMLAVDPLNPIPKVESFVLPRTVGLNPLSLNLSMM